VAAASHLAPAVIRVGGITADWVKYTDDGGRQPLRHGVQSGSTGWPTEERNLTMSTFMVLYDFMAAANLSLLFDLNELHGRNCHTPKPECPANPGCQAWCSGTWDMSNVRSFLQALHDKELVGEGSPLYAFEVGNELIGHECVSRSLPRQLPRLLVNCDTLVDCFTGTPRTRPLI